MNTRIVKRIKSRISELGIDLSSEIVLTEVGSNNYIYTPLIPALAGAERVFAWVRDSSFGYADSIISECRLLAEKLGCSERIEFFKGDFCITHLKQATIITNSGFIRPLNSEKLKWVASDAVIPLMFEAWEIRPDDIDINYAKEKGIKIAGTWENHPQLQIFKHVGPLAIKMAFEAGFEVFNNKIFVWSNDEFGEEASRAFRSLGAKKVIVSTEVQDLINFDNLDFIFFCDYHSNLSIQEILLDNLNHEKLANLGIIHLYGELDLNVIKSRVSTVYPNKSGRHKSMTFTLSHVGINPLVDLLVAGFRVGQSLRRNQRNSLIQII